MLPASVKGLKNPQQVYVIFEILNIFELVRMVSCLGMEY